MVLALFLVTGCAGTMQVCEMSGESPRERLSMDFGWKFQLGHLCDSEEDFGYVENRSKTNRPDGPGNPEFDMNGWPSVDLPHDWVVALEVDKDADLLHSYKTIGRKYPENCIGWYRKTFEIPRRDSGRRISLEFDGVFRDCEVWLNGYSLYRHLSGYTSFRVDITDYVKYGDKNVLVVRVDASGYELWSYEGAGIYRHVRLVKTEPLAVGHWGTYVRSEVKSGKTNNASVTIETNVANEQDDARHCKLISTIVDAEGETVGTVRSEGVIKGWANKEFVQKVEVKGAKLWSLESPHLYKLLTTVKERGRVTDRYETSFGIRTFSFDADSGFSLNGKAMKLNGVCLHQDHGGVGVAIPDALHDFRIKKMKEMGANAFRCAHNPPVPEALDAADRLGMLVIDETRAPGNTKERLGQLCSIVRRDRNHPSIILWSMANEERSLETSDTGARVIQRMKRLVRRLDRTRPITAALTHEGFDGPVVEVLDVVGCNYIRPTIDDLHKKHPGKPIILTESCCHSTARGIYEPDEAGRLTSYDENPACWGETADKMWNWCAERPWVGGTFIWTGFDYAGEPLSWEDDCGKRESEEVWPILHTQWGIVDRCGLEKDPFYYFKSWWTDEVVLHVFPHWNWQGKEGQEIRVWCYSNCEEVELIVNGKSLGKKAMPRNSHLEWKVKYEPGCIEVRGYNAGQLVATDREETTGEAAAIRLKPDKARIKADNHDVSQVTVEIVDEKGRVIPAANNEIIFSVSDNGKIIGACNGDPACHVPESQTTYPAFSGLLMVYVQSGFEAGVITLKAEAAGLEAAEAIIEAKPCAAVPFVPTATE
jgi:beta-galactosidase